MKRTLTVASLLASAGAVGFAGPANAVEAPAMPLPADNTAYTAAHLAAAAHGATQVVGDVVPLPTQTLPTESVQSTPAQTGLPLQQAKPLADALEALPAKGPVSLPQGDNSINGVPGGLPMTGIHHSGDLIGAMPQIPVLGDVVNQAAAAKPKSGDAVTGALGGLPAAGQLPVGQLPTGQLPVGQLPVDGLPLG